MLGKPVDFVIPVWEHTFCYIYNNTLITVEYFIEHIMASSFNFKSMVWITVCNKLSATTVQIVEPIPNCTVVANCIPRKILFRVAIGLPLRFEPKLEDWVPFIRLRNIREMQSKWSNVGVIDIKMTLRLSSLCQWLMVLPMTSAVGNVFELLNGLAILPILMYRLTLMCWNVPRHYLS